MYDYQPEDETASAKQKGNEELLSAKEEIELLHELVESHKLLIDKLEKELLEANQELKILDDQLGRTTMSGVSFDEAKAIAKQVLKYEQVGTVIVASILSKLYGSSVEAEELRQSEIAILKRNQVQNEIMNKVVAQSHKVIKNSEEFRSHYLELIRKFLIITTHLNSIKQQLASLYPPHKIFL